MAITQTTPALLKTTFQTKLAKNFNINNLDNAYYEKIVPKDGIVPIPRRDHSATLIRNGMFLLVYGGRNDNSSDLIPKNNMDALSDIMLFDIDKKKWTCMG